MSSDDTGLRARRSVQLLIERFPHVHAVALRLLDQHEAFRDLLEEYEVCSDVVERLSRTGAGSAMFKEYTALRLRLEGELLRYIAEHWHSQ